MKNLIRFISILCFVLFLQLPLQVDAREYDSRDVVYLQYDVGINTCVVCIKQTDNNLILQNHLFVNLSVFSDAIQYNCPEKIDFGDIIRLYCNTDLFYLREEKNKQPVTYKTLLNNNSKINKKVRTNSAGGLINLHRKV